MLATIPCFLCFIEPYGTRLNVFLLMALQVRGRLGLTDKFRRYDYAP